MTAHEALLAEAHDVQRKLRRMADRLEEAMKSAQSIPLDTSDSEDLIRLEALSARFERSIDVLLRTFLRLLDTLEGSEGGTIMDVLTRAEKRGLIDSADEFYDMRHNRNRIAHEYLDIEALEMAAFVRQKATALLESLRKSAAYSLK